MGGPACDGGSASVLVVAGRAVPSLQDPEAPAAHEAVRGVFPSDDLPGGAADPGLQPELFSIIYA